MMKRADIANKEIEQKEQENLRVRRELKECQEQLTLLHSFVKQLQVDLDKSNRSLGKFEKESITEKVTDSEGGSDDDDDDSDCSFSFSCDDESCDEEWSSQQEASDGEETISTFHAGVGDCRRNSVRKRSVHSRRNLRRGSVHSSKSSIRSASRQSIIRSTRGGGDDGDSIVSKLSMGYHSAAPSIKWRLPLEIELMGGNEENHHQDKDDYSAAPSIKWRLPLEIELLDGNEENHHQDKDDNFSLFEESYRKPDDDSRSVGLFSVTTSRTHQSSSRRNVTFSPSTKKDIPKEIDLHGGEDGNNGDIEGNDEYSYAPCRWSTPNWVEMSPVKSPRRTIYKGIEGFVTNSS